MNSCTLGWPKPAGKAVASADFRLVSLGIEAETGQMHVHLQRQLSVALENQPGRLAAVCRLLADHGVNIEGLSVIDNVEQGMVRLLVSDPVAARAVLEHAGFPVVEAEVICLELLDRLGKLAKVTEALAIANVNIEYAYSTVDHAGARTRMILKTSRPRKAHDVLSQLPLR